MLKKVQNIPDFSLPDQNNRQVRSSDFIGRAVIIYFYPKDFTPGCTREACGFEAQYEVLKSMGAEVIGISADPPETHKKFADKHHLSFPLLSDSDNAVRKLFGVKNSLFGILPGRATFIIDQQGIVQHVYSSQFNSREHVRQAVEVLKAITTH